MLHYFQIRNNDKPVEQHIYSSLKQACRALVARNDADFHLVELDTPGGVVIRTLTLVECKAILLASSSD